MNITFLQASPSLYRRVRTSGGKALLSVYADDNNGLLTQIFSQPALRSEAVAAIAAAIASSGRDGQAASFDGVVLDFESLRAGQKANYTAFLQELRALLGSKTIYVAIHPVLNGSAYYDGYDYTAIGQLADRVILMAYDFDAKALTESEMAPGLHPNAHVAAESGIQCGEGLLKRRHSCR